MVLLCTTTGHNTSIGNTTGNNNTAIGKNYWKEKHCSWLVYLVRIQAGIKTLQLVNSLGKNTTGLNNTAVGRITLNRIQLKITVISMVLQKYSHGLITCM
jgi:hypothetical protein